MKDFDNNPENHSTPAHPTRPQTADNATTGRAIDPDNGELPLSSQTATEGEHPLAALEPPPSAFFAEGRSVKDPCLMRKDLLPSHAPTSDPDGRFAVAQLVGAQLLSDALVRSFLRNPHRLDSLTTPSPVIMQWCEEQHEAFRNFAPLPPVSLTLAQEWAYDRSISYILFSHDYVQKLPVDPFDPNALRRYLQATVRNHRRNCDRLKDENLWHDDEHHPDLSERYAAPVSSAHMVRLQQDTLTEMCALLHLTQETADILFAYYYGDASREDIKATYGITIEAVRKRITRAVECHPDDAAKAQACLHACITALDRIEDISAGRKRRYGHTEEEQEVLLYTEATNWQLEGFTSERSLEEQEEEQS